MAYGLQLEFILSGKPKRVMELLTDPVLIRKWSGSEAIVENKVGGKFEMFDGWVTGKVLKTGAHELAYTWKTSEWPEAATPSEVHYLLREDEAGTKVILHHTGFPNEEEMKSHKSSWTDFFFDPMEDFILIIDKS
jgi:activator of HSP90 ATPase